MPYSEVLRVIGQYIDHNYLSEVRVIETDEGVILQGLVMKGEKIGQRATFEVTTEDIEDLFQDSYAQRGKEI